MVSIPKVKKKKTTSQWITGLFAKTRQVGKDRNSEEIEFLSIHSGHFAEQHLEVNVPSLNQMPEFRRQVFADEIEDTDADGEQNQAEKNLPANEPENLVILATLLMRGL
jgi:hypothetical protein